MGQSGKGGDAPLAESVDLLWGGESERGWGDFIASPSRQELLAATLCRGGQEARGGLSFCLPAVCPTPQHRQPVRCLDSSSGAVEREGPLMGQVWLPPCMSPLGARTRPDPHGLGVCLLPCGDPRSAEKPGPS